jgi:site-specific DNA-methyltransferase (adenine-specific)
MPVSEVKLIDCMEYMRTFPDKYFELAIVDPPYGYRTENTAILNFRMEESQKEWNVAPDDAYFKELLRVSKNQIVWGGNYFGFLWQMGGRCFIYWHKGNPVENFADGELAWTSFDKNAKQFDYRYYGNLDGKTSAGNKIHPTQKPVALYKWLLSNYAKEGDKILDTHLGSGSSRIAAYIMGFDFYACEIDKDYYEAQEKRFKEQTAQQSLFNYKESA